ncbi:MAG TPA: thioredoxin fold domain-containing protein [Flavipsychrobacter sp.]|nr:thioredoxin fold domain-containing protein [Flavipsychrobacter sp.]
MKAKLTLLLSMIAFVAASFAQQKTDFTKKGAPLPNFYINRTDGGYIIPNLLKKSKPVMIVIFSPQCDHCEFMVDSLRGVRDQFQSTQLVMVAEDRHKDFMDGFMEKTKIKGDALFKNIGTNKGELIAAIYTNKMLPQIVFYDANHKLVKIFDGQYKFADVAKYIK